MGAVYLAERADESIPAASRAESRHPHLLHATCRSGFALNGRFSRASIIRISRDSRWRPHAGRHAVHRHGVHRGAAHRSLLRAEPPLDASASALIQQVRRDSLCAPAPDRSPGSETANILVTKTACQAARLRHRQAPRSAAAADSAPITRFSRPGADPEHASPEQLRGERVGTVSDVYSLGVLMYELLTGRHPYKLANRSLYEIERANLRTASMCLQAPACEAARAKPARHICVRWHGS